MNNIKLSDRLMMNVSMVSKTDCIADIGCDHAYASIWLVQNKVCNRVIAMDVNEGPLKKAAENIERYGLKDSISIRLSDGTKKLEKGEADGLIIGGMGGMLIVSILDARPDVISLMDQLILQPQSDAHKVRQYLRSIGMKIDREEMLCEDGKYYTSIRAVKKEKDCRKDNLTDDIIFDMYGEYLLDNKNEVLKERLLKQLELLKKSGEKSEGNEQLLQKIEYIERGLKFYGM